MKKLFALGIFTLSALPLFSQTTEIGFLGAEVSIGVFGVYDDRITQLENNQNNYYVNTGPEFLWETSTNSSPIIFADLSFLRYKKLEVGVNIGYEKLSTNKATFGSPDPNTGLFPTENVAIGIFSFMPELRINWVTAADGKFQMYSGASFGLAFIDEKHATDTDQNVSYKQPAVHVNGIGLRFGDKFGGFMELGVGSRGFISCGLSYRP